MIVFELNMQMKDHFSLVQVQILGSRTNFLSFTLDLLVNNLYLKAFVYIPSSFILSILFSFISSNISRRCIDIEGFGVFMFMLICCLVVLSYYFVLWSCSLRRRYS
jgi:hypothetical protein